jgi:hypothetical protein
VTKRFYRDAFPKGVHPPTNYVRIYANKSWRVLAAPGCA